MSSDLPARPSLEFLKKLAKERLRDLQQRDPSAKLADAQHAVAREYGFLNWAQLKASVTSMPRPEAVPNTPPVPASPAASVFARFTERARRATFFSRFEAAQFGRPEIHPEHLLIGVIKARSDVRGGRLGDSSLTVDQLRLDVVSCRAAADPLSTMVIIPFSADTKRVIQAASREADELRHHDIGTAHLLLGLAADPASVAASILREHGVTHETVRQHLPELLDDAG